MQCRAIARRCPSGSMTVLGDLAQATTPWAPGDWAATLRHLAHPLESGTELRALTAGYRVPEEVLQFANRLLPHIAADVPSATSVRHGADALQITRGSAVSTAVRRCLAVEGSIGVITADAQVDQVLAALQAADIDAHLLDADLDARVEVVAATQAKGLEFDSVVVVEPAQIVAAEHHRVQGLRRLYVALTRAVSRLSVVHEQPLPPELGN
jgi:DNA helicase IV